MAHANFSETTLAAGLDIDDTSLTVAASTSFPATPFIAFIDTECFNVTDVTGVTWTVTRGYESSTAATHDNGAKVIHEWSAGEASATVLGPASVSADGNLVLFNGTTGKIIKDGGACTAAGLALLDDANAAAQIATLGLDADIATLSLPASTTITAAGAALIDDATAADQLTTLGAMPLAGGTMTGNLIMDNMDVTLVKLLTLHGEIDDGNSGTDDTIDWNTGTAHKSTLTGNVTFAFTGYGANLVPDMTANNAPSGLASASSEASPSYAAWIGFDKDVGNNRWWPTDGVTPSWLKYQFATATVVSAFSVVPFYSGGMYNPTALKLSGSDDDNAWTELASFTGLTTGWSQDVYRYFDAANTHAYLYYKLDIPSGTYGGLTELGLHSGAVNPGAPCFLILKLVQDGTGGRTVTWPATVKGIPVIDLTASSTSNIFFYWDGTSYWTLNGLRPSETWGYQTTTTATGTTTLTVDSRKLQFFTGTAAQTVKLPVTSTLAVGQEYIVRNNSTLAVTVQSSGANSILVLAGGETGVFTCITLAGTGAANWSAYTTARKDVAQVFASTVTSTQFLLSALNTAPSAANDTGTLGEIRIVAAYIYVCTATNTWVRAAIATW